jgi:Flp pilus assembly protein TadB
LLKAKTKNDAEFNKLAKNNEYILASKSKDSKRFRANFAELWKKLIAQAGTSIVLDGYMLQHLLHWIEALCQYAFHPPLLRISFVTFIFLLQIYTSPIQTLRNPRCTRFVLQPG